MLKKVEKIINNFIAYNYTLKNKYNYYVCRRDLLKELIIMLDNDYNSILENSICISLLFDTIYHDSNPYFFFYKALLKSKSDDRKISEVKLIVSKVKEDFNIAIANMEKLDKEISNKADLLLSAQKLKFYIKNSIPIKSKKDLKNAKEILCFSASQKRQDLESNEQILSKKELGLLINEIEFYNRLLASKNASQENKEYTKVLYNEVPSVLNAGYETFENIDVQIDRRPTLDKKVEEISRMLLNLNENELLEVLDRYGLFYPNASEFNYILINILKKIQDELLTEYELLIDNGLDKYSEKKQIVNDYYKELNKYLLIRKYCDDYNDFTVDTEENEEDNAELVGEQKPKRIIFSHSTIDPAKAKVIDDMYDTPEEYYKDIISLIERFITGDLTRKEIKPLNNNRKLLRYRELRNDQIRIIFKHVKDNIYCICGISTKKDNNDKVMYKRMANRMIPNIDKNVQQEIELQLGELTLCQLRKIVASKSRKGNR